jgi:penicillin-insensitive murein endopeptidase
MRSVTPFASIATVLVAMSSAALANPWAAVRDVAPGPASSIGKYTAGCLVGGEALTDDQPGIIHMRPQRHRNFGHPDLLAFLRGLSGHMTKERQVTMLVGDLGMPRGGPTLTNHVSHQSGLDVDIWFDVEPAGKTLGKKTRQTRSASSYVNWPKKKLLKGFGPEQRALIEYSANQPEVERVFVNPVIKRSLCTLAKGDRKWLRKVRPWWGHADHLHVRLRCPPLSKNCRSQAAPPPGDGCGEPLNWWLTRADAERAAARKNKPKGPRRIPKLPTACAAALQASQ